MNDILLLGVVLLVTPVIAEYAKIRIKAEESFSYLASSGILFLFVAMLDILKISQLPPIISTFFEWAALLIAAVGVLTATYKLLVSR